MFLHAGVGPKVSGSLLNFINICWAGRSIASRRKLQNGKNKILPDEFVEIKNVEIIEGIFSIPATEYVEVVVNFVARMGCSRA